MQDDKYVILYVEDDSDFLDSMRVILESKGYIFVGAPSAEEGLRAYKNSKPDLIIADLMMEEVDAGTNFVRELQAIGNKAPIYMLSSVGDDLNSTADYSGLGLAGIFQKPVDPDNLLQILKTRLQ